MLDYLFQTATEHYGYPSQNSCHRKALYSTLLHAMLSHAGLHLLCVYKRNRAWRWDQCVCNDKFVILPITLCSISWGPCSLCMLWDFVCTDLPFPSHGVSTFSDKRYLPNVAWVGRLFSARVVWDLVCSTLNYLAWEGRRSVVVQYVSGGFPVFCRDIEKRIVFVLFHDYLCSWKCLHFRKPSCSY